MYRDLVDEAQAYWKERCQLPDEADAAAAAAAYEEARALRTHGPLHSAALEGRADLVESYLAQGADVNQRDWDGSTALHAAAYGGHDDVVKLLLRHGADINSVASGETPLHWAAGRGHKDTVATLLQAGADPRIKNPRGHTPKDVAEIVGFVDVVECLNGRRG